LASHKLNLDDMSSSAKKMKTIDTFKTELEQTTQHSTKLRHFEDEVLPMLCSKKIELGILEADNTRHTNAFRRAGNIPSRDSDLLSQREFSRVYDMMPITWWSWRRRSNMEIGAC
jgi:hypothetical protein